MARRSRIHRMYSITKQRAHQIVGKRGRQNSRRACRSGSRNTKPEKNSGMVREPSQPVYPDRDRGLLLHQQVRERFGASADVALRTFNLEIDKSGGQFGLSWVG